MATITKTFTENKSSSNKSTWTFTVSASDVTVTGSSISFPTATIKAKYVGSNKGYGYVYLDAHYLPNASYDLNDAPMMHYGKNSGGTNAVAMTSGTTYTISRSEWYTNGMVTSDIFNSNNPTSKSVNMLFCSSEVGLQSENSSGSYHNEYNSSNLTSWGALFTITLNAPPTFTATGTMAGSFENQATYTATLSDCTAKFGGSIMQTKLTIGSQSVTGSGNGALSISLNTAGTFTPQVSVTDSRGQVTTKSLAQITVLPNICDIQSLNIQRIDSTTFNASDEGENAVIALVVNYTEFSGNYLEQPVVKINGTTTNNVTWYESWTPTGGFSNPIAWSSYAPSSPAVMYGKVTDQLAQQNSYSISVAAYSTTVTSKTISTTLSQAFYLLAGLAGGHGLGIGMKPPSDGLHVNMGADFYQDVSIDGDASIGGNTTITGNISVADISASGDATVTGDLFINGNSSATGTDILYTNDSTVTSVSSAKTLGYIELPKGVWLIRAYVTFAGTTSADGFRRASISTTQDNMATQAFGVDSKYVAGNYIIVCNPVRVITVTSPSVTYYLNASASNTVTISNRSMRAVRLV